MNCKGIRTRDPGVRAVEGLTHPVSYGQHFSKNNGQYSDEVTPNILHKQEVKSYRKMY
jgi:hypothetical protein